MAPDPILTAGLTTGILAGVIGLSFLLRAWITVRRGPGGDLSPEVVYLKGPDLVRPFAILILALFIGVLAQAYWMLLAFGVVPLSPDLRLHALVLQSLALLVGGFTFYNTLRGFTPAARTTRRREILQLLAEAVRSRGSALRRSKE